MTECRDQDQVEEPSRYDRYQEWLLERAGDIRCVCATTCPFHHPPGEELSVSGALAPWDDLKDRNGDDQER